MSRCFPYGAVLCPRNVARGEALIEPIKLHCKKDKSTKTESSKEKKRERKEKRKERKEEVKPCVFSDAKVKKLNNEKCCQEEKNRAFLGQYLPKKSEDEEAELLETSSLTDEHNEPVCYLSDGTQSSNKRKRPSPSTTTPSITVHKNILRIRLQSLRHSNKVEEATPILDSLRKDRIAQFDANAGNGTLNEKILPGIESFYKAFVEGWLPPSFQSGLNDRDDEEWLFGTKRLSHEFKRLKAGNDVPCCEISNLWPCSHYLPEADIYALPYSIPF